MLGPRPKDTSRLGYLCPTAAPSFLTNLYFFISTGEPIDAFFSASVKQTISPSQISLVPTEWATDKIMDGQSPTLGACADVGRHDEPFIFDFGRPVKIGSYTFEGRANLYYPYSWQLRGSNDAENLIGPIIDVQGQRDTTVEGDFGDTMTHHYNVATPGMYQYYTLYFTSRNADVNSPRRLCGVSFHVGSHTAPPLPTSLCSDMSLLEVEVSASNVNSKSVEVPGVYECNNLPLNRVAGIGKYEVTAVKNHITVRRTDDVTEGWSSTLVLQCSVCPGGGTRDNPDVPYLQDGTGTPAIASVSPPLVVEGTSITIEGTLLVLEGSSAPSVHIAGKPCAVLSVSGNSTFGTITCTAPGQTAGIYRVEVVNAYGSTGLSSEDDLALTYPLTISSVTSDTGSVLGGQWIDVHGSGYSTRKSDLAVTVGGKPCEDVEPVDASTLRCLTPSLSQPLPWQERRHRLCHHRPWQLGLSADQAALVSPQEKPNRSNP